MKTNTLKADGFSLIELMVVVAIIGILAAVAVPNFRTYQAKSKTSEAKLSLAGIYTAQTSFFTDYDSYATCLGVMGVAAPTAGERRYYSFGFNADQTLAVDNGSGCNGGAENIRAYAASRGTGGQAATAVGDLTAGNNITAVLFQAGAIGHISAAGDDEWSINQDKVVNHASIGY